MVKKGKEWFIKIAVQYYKDRFFHDKALEVKDVKELYAQRGDLYFLLKDYVNASNDYYRALALDPKDEELMKKKAKANEYVDYMPYPSRHEDWTVIDIDELGYSLIEWDYEQEEMDDRLALYWQDAEYYMANGLVEP